MNKIQLHYSNASHRGPGKVVQNLSTGLSKLDLLSEAQDDSAVFHGVLQMMPGANAIAQKDSNTCIFGPNLVVLPNELPPDYLGQVKHFVVPSEWVKKLYRQFPCMDKITIDTWSVGIDTDRWMPADRGIKNVGPITENLRCLVYWKNRSRADLQFVQNTLSARQIECKILEYGNYQEDDLDALCSWAHFGILLTNTESQGIAYMEMLSTDLPLFVYNQPWWNYDGSYPKVEASSVPYFDKFCGEITVEPNEALFDTFLANVRTWKYSPRAYILANHTLIHGAQNYYNLFLRYEHQK